MGAGGGSIAWVDPGGALKVGPQSAGADPGPACYGRGGERPTVTDADVVLGRLDPGYFAGGTIKLSPDKKFFVALTVASGDRYAGLQAGDMYVYWRRIDKRIAVHSVGDVESLEKLAAAWASAPA